MNLFLCFCCKQENKRSKKFKFIHLYYREFI
nr:MAG TPA: hypothetical protein [Caudoviricetes sp.]